MSKDQMNQKQLNQLYNKPVVSAERVERPMPSSANMNIPFVQHEGVKITTGDGQQYLVHKGSGYGQSSNTVVTPANNMSSNWRTTDSKEVHQATVGDYVKAGGNKYNVVTDNCQDASKRMMKNN